jgi:hypothetical protein
VFLDDWVFVESRLVQAVRRALLDQREESNMIRDRKDIKQYKHTECCGLQQGFLNFWESRTSFVIANSSGTPS